MPWALRARHWYYYRHEDHGAGDKRVYYGRGERARLIARLDAIQAAQLEVERDALARFLDLMRDCRDLLEYYNADIADELTKRGYHRNQRGAWQKRRIKRRGPYRRRSSPGNKPNPDPPAG